METKGRDPSVCRFCNEAPAGHPVAECKGFAKGTFAYTSDGPISIPAVDPAGPWKPDLPTTVALVNAGVIPRLQVLLYNMFSVVDASLPNKDQNRAVRKLIQSAFDEAYFGIIRVAYPDSNFESGPGPAISPQPDIHAALNQPKLG